MSKKKSLRSIQAEKHRLENIERQIIDEMTAVVGRGTLNLFVQDPTNPLWRKDPQMLARLQELTTAGGTQGCSRVKSQGEPATHVRDFFAGGSGGGAVGCLDNRENGATGPKRGV